MYLKKIMLSSFCFVCLCLLAGKVHAQQNLVPNPSFEDTIQCPLGPGEIYNSNGWNSFNGTPDYMHACNQFSMGVPVNWGGYQQAASGNAYAAIATYISSISNGREHLGRQLSSPLIIGTKYYVSFQTSLSLGSAADGNCASDKIGVRFTVLPYSGSDLINNNPKVYTNSIVTDSSNWTRIFGSFIADSGYNHIVLGNFFDDLNTNTTKFYNTFSDVAYYFLDDVCVSTDSSFASSYYTGISKYDFEHSFSISPNPTADYITIRNHSRKYDLRIYNTLGKELYLIKNVTKASLILDVRNFENGLLIINLSSDKFNCNFKLIKQ